MNWKNFKFCFCPNWTTVTRNPSLLSQFRGQSCQQTPSGGLHNCAALHTAFYKNSKGMRFHASYSATERGSLYRRDILCLLTIFISSMDFLGIGGDFLAIFLLAYLILHIRHIVITQQAILLALFSIFYFIFYSYHNSFVFATYLNTSSCLGLATWSAATSSGIPLTETYYC